MSLARRDVFWMRSVFRSEWGKEERTEGEGAFIREESGICAVLACSFGRPERRA